MNDKLRRALVPGLGAVALLGGLSWFVFGRTPSPPPKAPTAAQVKAPAPGEPGAASPAPAKRRYANERLHPALTAKTFTKQAKHVAKTTSSSAKAGDGTAVAAPPTLSAKIMGDVARSGGLRKRAFDDPALRSRLQSIRSTNRRLNDGATVQRRIPQLTRSDSIRNVKVDKQPVEPR
jgi:hypothetical protein